MKRKNITLLACLFLAFLPWNLRAQEVSYTIGSSTWGQLKNGYSIVREIDINRHMVFTFYEGGMTFSLVDENLLTVSLR